MKPVVAVVAVSLLLSSCISWNSRQKEVVDVYRGMVADAGDSNWSSLLSCFSRDTRELLKHAAEVFTDAGIPFDNSPSILLEAMYTDTEVLDFSPVIVSVDFIGSKAVLTAGEGRTARQLVFVNESGRWKMDLSEHLHRLWGTLFAGTSMASAPFGTAEAVPTYLSHGSGPCALLIRNALSGTAIHHVFCTLSTDDSWGNDLLGPSILGTGAELGIHTAAGVYDVQILDSRGGRYTLWQVELDPGGAVWEVTEADMDPPSD